VFDGQILRYRIVNTGGTIVAASDFQEIGKSIANSQYWKFVEKGETHGHVEHLEPGEHVEGISALSHAIAPLSWQGRQRGAIEIEADVSGRVKQLNRLRYIAFVALVGLLAAVIGILGLTIVRAQARQRLAQQNILRSERQYRLLLDGAPDSMVIHDQERVLYANEAAASLHGAPSREAMIGLDPMLLVPPDKRLAVRSNRQKTLERDEISKTESLGRRRLDGTIVETDSMGIPIEWDGKRCLLVQSRDMTKQREVQREIAFREAQLSAFMENMQAMMFMTDTDNRITLVNRRYEEFHGVKSVDIIGKTVSEWAPDDVSDQFVEQDREVIESGIPMSWESSIAGDDGKKTIIRDDVFPIRDDLGNIIGLGGISTDITNDRMREENINRALRTAERASAELQAFLNSSPSGMYLKDRNLNITLVNRAFEKFYGKTSDEIIGHAVRTWMPKQLADEIEMLDMEVLRTGEHLSIEYEVENAAGETRVVEFNKYPILAGDGNVVGIGGFNNDVTEQRLQATEIEETQARLSAYFDHVPMIVVLLDRHSNIMMANSRYAEFFGISLEQAHTDHDRPWLDDDIREAFETDNETVFSDGDVIEHVFELGNAKGEIRILHQVKFPIKSDAGSGGAIGVFMSDITEQKRHEREIEEARDEAEAANRAKSAFLANMSHEIRTPMNGVFGMADLLAQSNLSADQQRYLNTIRRSGEALLGVINNVLDVSRIEAGEFRLDKTTFNLDDLVADAVELFAETASAKGLVIAHNISANVPRTVEADDVRLRQVLINLIGNAIKFTDEGEIVVRVVRIGGNAESALVRFEVTDSGIGIPRHQQITLFDPFQQADSSITRKFGGTGLGLSIAQHIIGLMRGRIDVDSQPGAGSSFVFSIPLTVVPASADEETDTSDTLAGKRLLIVDDNSVNREILCEFTRDWGLDPVAVATAHDAQAAMRDALHSGSAYDFALLDIQMPDMNGMELAEWIRARADFADMKLVALTSFNWDRDSLDARNAGFSHFATKPVRRTDLKRILVDAVQRGPAADTGRAQPPAEASAPEEPDQPRMPTYGVKVLLAEDNPVNQELGQEYFKRMECSVTVASNGLEAVEKFRDGDFGLVLMDVQMPDLDGIQATIRIRDIEARLGSDRVPIIAATAHAFQEDREKCILAGMDDFLSKPDTRKDIVPIMERWIGSDAVALPAPPPDIRPARETVTKDQGLLDPATIDQLRAMDASGEDRIFRKVAGIFLDTTPDQLEGLKGHLANEDAPGIALIAHGLKTAAANVAALSLSQLFRELELAAREEDLHTCGTLSEDVFDLFGKVAAALKEVTEADRSVRESA